MKTMLDTPEDFTEFERELLLTTLNRDLLMLKFRRMLEAARSFPVARS